MRTMSRLLGILGLLGATFLILGAYMPTAVDADFCAFDSGCVSECVDYCTRTTCHQTWNGWDCTGPYAAAYNQCHYECVVPACCIN